MTLYLGAIYCVSLAIWDHPVLLAI